MRSRSDPVQEIMLLTCPRVAAMPSAEEIVDFLRQKEAVREGQSPWLKWDGKERREAIPWDGIFPSSRSRRPRGDLGDVVLDVNPDDGTWRPTIPEDVEGRVARAIGERPSEPPFPDGQNTNIPEAQRILGVWDRCAWYQPMHYFGNDWGIYIRRKCLHERMEEVARFLPAATMVDRPLLEALYRSAFASFFLHEQFHHMVESLGIRMHVVQRRSAYLEYKAKVYRPSKGSDDNLEEALATANAYQRIGDDPYGPWIGKPVRDATWAFIEWRVPSDPPGYRMAKSYFDWYQFDAGQDVLQAQFDEAKLKPSRNPHDWAFATRMMQSMFKVTDHLWEIV